MQKDNYILLIEKLDQFIRKYYFNNLIRGVIYSTALLLAFYLIISIAEYNFYFSPLVRKTMFFGFIIISVFLIGTLILSPILKIQKLGKTISHKQAATIIGLHFDKIKDKLINILQLKNNEVSLEQAALIEASINQKSLELKPIPFSSAINLNENKHYLRYAIPPLFIFFGLLFLKPAVIKDSSQRLFKNDIVFEKPMPFKFIIQEDSLSALQFEDYRLNIKIKGEETPNEMFIYRKTLENNFTKVVPQKLNTTNYSYIFSNLQKDVIFYFEANGYKSKHYVLEVSQKPMITNFDIHLNYPKYLGRKKATLKNTGDIFIPFGTSVTWIFEAIATEKINMRFSDGLIPLNARKNKQFVYSKTLTISDKYTVKTINSTVNINDSLQFSIEVVNDEYPQITVKEVQDSTNIDNYFYIGEISDDYGLNKLTFNYKIENSKKAENNKTLTSKDIAFDKNTLSAYSHYWNIKELDLKPGDNLSYYFQVWDNDGVNGSKSSRTRWMNIKTPTIDELENSSEKEFEELKKGLTKAIQKAQDLQKEMKLFREKLLNKTALSWDDKKQIKEMVSEQKELQKEISNMNESLEKNIKKQSDYKKISPELAKKQEQIQKLFDEVLDEEMKNLIKKYEEMLKELDKENALEQTEEMQVTDEELEKELDRMLEMLKKMEFEQKLQETQEKLKNLAEKQERIAEKENNSIAEKQKEQEEINDAFKKLQEDIKELDQLDEELGNKVDMDQLEKDGEDISKDIEKAKEDLSNNKSSKASKSQQSAADKMKKMVDKMGEMATAMQAESMEEDMQALRQLLENLISLSFAEEYLFETFKTTRINTPKYVELIQEQHKLIEDSEHVEDSLFALAKRVIQIESFITDKIFDINRNLDEAVKQLENRVVRKAIVNQQYVMTGFNDLALMLSEVLQQMQQQMAQQMPGNQSCEKPGGKNPKPSKIPSLKKMQQQLSDQINKMGEQMKEGKGNKPGGQNGQSKELAKMAAKQQAIREALQKVNADSKKEGGNKGTLGDLQKIIEDMKHNETDLVNKQITKELLERQQDILVKLLEAESAERNRDKKEERKSEIAIGYKKESPPALKDYLEKRKASLLLYKQLPPNLKPYYRSISEKYFYNSTK